MEEVAADIISTGFGYLAVWCEVADTFKNQGRQLFGLTAKAHLLAHCLLLSRCPMFDHLQCLPLSLFELKKFYFELAIWCCFDGFNNYNI